MKVVINVCYGGFGLSHKALLWLAERKSKWVRQTEPSEYYGDQPGWEEQFAEAQQRDHDSPFGLTLYEGKILCLNDRADPEFRGDAQIIECIETLGVKEAAASLAELLVVEIPDGVDYYIDEYDGTEKINEQHRSWP